MCVRVRVMEGCWGEPFLGFQSPLGQQYTGETAPPDKLLLVTALPR